MVGKTGTRNIFPKLIKQNNFETRFINCNKLDADVSAHISAICKATKSKSKAKICMSKHSFIVNACMNIMTFY